MLNKVSTRDLNNFSVQIHRLGNKDWNNLTVNDEIVSAIPESILNTPDNEELINSHLQNLMKRQYSWTARLELQYEVNV